jgi:glyoxylase-like metal-dependent hydrolase (beta-lactamase superfamily II)
MNEQEAELSYVFGDALPATGSVFKIAPGILWARMGLPFALNHINVWLIEDTVETDAGLVRGYTIVDCGISSPETRANWEAIFAAHLGGLPIVRVIITHSHPDHVGLADWLCQRWQVPLLATTGEYAFARMMSATLPGVDGTSSTPHFARHGLTDPALLEKLQGRNHYYQTLVPSVPHSYVRLHDGQQVMMGGHAWEIITGFGHSPEHAALYAKDLGILISGDMVLPRISTNVSVFAVEPLANPVQQFTDSLQRYLRLPEDTLVLPSHGKPFKGLHQRVRQLCDHHRDRLQEVWAFCVTPQSAVDILPLMFKRPLDTHQLSFALGEALGHLHQLWYAGKLRRILGEDGIYRFAQVV